MRKKGDSWISFAVWGLVLEEIEFMEELSVFVKGRMESRKVKG